MGDWGYHYKMSAPEHFWLIIAAILLLGGVVAVAVLAPRLQNQRTQLRLADRDDSPTPTPPPTATAFPSRTPRPTPTALPAATATLTAEELVLRIGGLIQQAQEPLDKHDWPQAINLLLAARAMDRNNPDAIQKLYMTYYLYGQAEAAAGNQANAIKQFQNALGVKSDGAEAQAALAAMVPPTATYSPPIVITASPQRPRPPTPRPRR